MKTNHAMLLTPPGAAAIAVVRISGPRTPEFLRRHFSRDVLPRRALHGTLSDGANLIDDPLIVLHDDRQTADISVHGGPWVVRQTLDLARRSGFDVIQGMQSPLPDMALDGDDKIQREIHALLPLAKTEFAVHWLLSQAAVHRRRAARNLPHNPLLAGPLSSLLHPPPIAIIGAANVGKSTIANQLFGQERSITADIPGTTRDWVGEIADIDGLAIFLMDTPGLRQSDDPIEQAAIAASHGEIRQADLIVLVIDATQPLPEQREWCARYPDALVIRNKSDRQASAQSIDPHGARPHLHTTATTGAGIPSLRQALRRHFIPPWRHPRTSNFHNS